MYEIRFDIGIEVSGRRRLARKGKAGAARIVLRCPS
jgi:hypothetical protein